MITFNSNHIFGNYIKQFLASVNLPTYNNNWTGTDKQYYYNKFMLNSMRNFVINSNNYDSYTHEFLGDYLRFYRDFTGIDLMLLYNCFSSHICPSVKYDILPAGIKVSSFDSTDKNYKIYMMPVRPGKRYVIAIDEPKTIEVCCGLYDTKQLPTDLPTMTYKKFNHCQFTMPFIYETNTIENSINLHLFLKVPVTNTSSITILEWQNIDPDHPLTTPMTYFNYNDTYFTKLDNLLYKRISNKTVVNYEYEEALDAFKPITNLQLLRMNTGVSYPFADRLMEYLTGNAITPEDPIADNIIRVQEVLKTQKIAGQPVNFDHPGIWESKIRTMLYENMQKDGNNAYNTNHDILGYVDKDVENCCAFKIKTGQKPTDYKIVSLNNIDIYPDIYKDTKRGK